MPRYAACGLVPTNAGVLRHWEKQWGVCPYTFLIIEERLILSLQVISLPTSVYLYTELQLLTSTQKEECL